MARGKISGYVILFDSYNTVRDQTVPHTAKQKSPWKTSLLKTHLTFESCHRIWKSSTIPTPTTKTHPTTMARARKRKAASSTVPEEQQKQQQERESAWKKVDVSLPSDDGFGETKTSTDNNNNNTDHTNEADLDNEYSTKNHYDDPTMGRTKYARNDLEAAPGEDVAIFSGLQVIQGSDYHIEKTSDGQSLFRILTDGEKKKAKKPASAKANDAAAASKTAAKAKTPVDDEVKVSKKRKKPKDVKTDTPMEEEAETNTTFKPADSDSATSKPADSEAASTEAPETGVTTKKKKKRRKQKKKPKDPDAANSNTGEQEEEKETDDPVQIQALQMSWTTATAGCQLHPVLAAALLQQSFWTPTPIQAAVLPAAILGRRNIVGAAPTGSGKTLAFLLPICQYLLEQRDEQASVIGDEMPHNHDKIQALIVTPTRELAMQIHAEAAKLLSKGAGRNSDTTNTSKASVNHHLTGLIVGGLAHAKQQRVLEKSRPPIIVATPGRLWELVCCFES
jgi:hypothetical protein